MGQPLQCALAGWRFASLVTAALTIALWGPGTGRTAAEGAASDVPLDAELDRVLYAIGVRAAKDLPASWTFCRPTLISVKRRSGNSPGR